MVYPATACCCFSGSMISIRASRARSLVDRLEQEPRINSHTGTLEFARRDPDGYYVMVSALSEA
ncbi:hypothetical protein [Paraburkholderia youngii]|uniref:hypothetical protein n=1 Tax=Paraburkholderia youngii TaxID=2782701 RepID=UPI001C3DA4C8|nr:hypothetical protein [Paraburkholderia youngii]